MAKMVKIVCTAAMFLLLVAYASAVPAWGQEHEFLQPDGSVVPVRVWGDEYYRRMESIDGYTLIREKLSNWLCYAVLSEDQAELLPSGCIYPGTAMPQQVRQQLISQSPPAIGFNKSLRLNSHARKQIVAKRRQALFGDVAVPQEAFESSAPVSGQIEGLTMLIDFPDAAGTISQSSVQDFCNLIGYNGNNNNGSVRDYFYDVSGGNLVYTNTVTPYIRADNTKLYYDTANDGARTLIKECFRKLIDSGFDLSAVTGSDSTILALNVFYAGSWGSDELWPHQWVISSLYPYTYSYGGYTIKTYQITGMQDYLKLGTFCHENGHLVCDWPDLYDYDYDSRGLGDYCLMASGSYAGGQLNPAVPCAYLRAEQGWDTVIDITSQPPSFRSHLANSLTCYRYSHPTSSSEYFLIESRIRSGRNADYPDEGLVIWHVDENGSNDYQEMTPSLHYLVSLEQADGAFHLENDVNYGGSGDLFHAGYKSVFSDATLPDAKWWNGSDSGLLIQDISQVGATMSFVFGQLAEPMPPVAADVNELTMLDTPITITLDAADEGLPFPPGALSYIITSLPNHGTLADPNDPNTVFVSVPRILSGNEVIYTPRPGCSRPAAFTYLANDGGTAPEGGDSNIATVTVAVTQFALIYSANMDTNPGWTYESDWVWGTPTGSGGSYGNPDPASGYTGSNIVGYNLAGDYKKNIRTTEWTTTPAIDCSGRTGVTLSFYRWLNVEGPDYDHAYMQVSNNASTWTTVWQNPSEITDSSWTLQTFDISAVADNQPTVYVRWGMGTTDGFWQYSGWNIDDVTVTGAIPVTETLAGDFEPDCDVDFDDLTRLIYYWLQSCGDCGGTDLVADGIVSLADLRVLADNWLVGL